MKLFNRLTEFRVALAACVLSFTFVSLAQERPMKSSTNHTETAVFGGGCYWCTEAIYQMLPGVKSVQSGFAGGSKDNPTYEEVCTGATGHAEVIEVEYDPSVITYEKLLHTFWEAHDPTTLNRQGPDSGTQYRSIILYKTPEEKATAEKSKAEAQKNFKDPIVTQIVPLKKFWKADDYHQNYFRTHPNQPYCRTIIRPKVEKFEEKLKEAEKQ
jgi:peptide-methionine (S)-S-oxide reductase